MRSSYPILRSGETTVGDMRPLSHAHLLRSGNTSVGVAILGTSSFSGRARPLSENQGEMPYGGRPPKHNPNIQDIIPLGRSRPNIGITYVCPNSLAFSYRGKSNKRRRVGSFSAAASIAPLFPSIRESDKLTSALGLRRVHQSFSRDWLGCPPLGAP